MSPPPKPAVAIFSAQLIGLEIERPWFPLNSALKQNICSIWLVGGHKFYKNMYIPVEKSSSVNDED